MNKTIKQISRIRDEFDIVVCGVNGVLTDGQRIFPESIYVLVKLYQSGKKIAFKTQRRAYEYFLCGYHSR